MEKGDIRNGYQGIKIWYPAW